MSETIERMVVRPLPSAAVLRPDFARIPAYVEPARPPAPVTQADVRWLYFVALFIVTAVTALFFGLHFYADRPALPPLDPPMHAQAALAEAASMPEDVPLPAGIQTPELAHLPRPAPPPKRAPHPTRTTRPSKG